MNELMPAEQKASEIMTEEVRSELEKMRRSIAQLTSAIIAQQTELEKLNRVLSTVRLTRTQETAIKEAVRARSRLLVRAEGLSPASEQRVAAAIRTTLRETTGARAMGDIQGCQFDRAMELVQGWRMAGALRRIRKETEAQQGGRESL